jgi:hypothetical protein
MRSFEPDVVDLSPLVVETGSPQGDHLRAADRLDIPTVLVARLRVGSIHTSP